MEAVYEMVLPGNNICHSEIIEQVGQHGQTITESLSLNPSTSAGRLSVSEDGPGPRRCGVQTRVRSLLLQ